MLHGSQKRFDKDGDGKLSMREWNRWYYYAVGADEDARKRRAAHAAAEQKRAEIAENFANHAADIINWMYHDLEHLEGEREDQAIRTMHLALYVISAALQTQKIDDAMRYLLRAFWREFQPTLGESVYQGLCAKQLIFEEIGVIRSDRLGSFWQELLGKLPPERRVGKDADLQELLDDTSRLYNYFRDESAPEMDYAAAIEPYWAKIRLPEESEEEPELDEDEPDEDTESEEAELQPDVPEQNGFYTFCMVQFGENGTSYAYLTGGISLKAGDFVIVPAGKYDKERLGRVTDVFIRAAQDAPYPPERTKFVLRKAEQTAFPAKKPASTPPAAAKPKADTPKAAEAPVPAQPVVESPAVEQPKTEVPETAPVLEPSKEKCRVPWGWLVAAAAVAAFVIFALPPLKRTAEAQRQKVIALQAEQKAERKRAEELRLAEEAEQQRQQEEREAALQAEKDAGIPYVGMLESSIDSTRTLGVHGMAKSGWAYKKNGTLKQMTYFWYTSNRTPIFTAVCQDGKVIETQKIDGYWSGNTLLAPVVKPDIPTTFRSGSSGSIRDDYDNPEDLYEDNPDWYDDEDEAWDEWEND